MSHLRRCQHIRLTLCIVNFCALYYIYYIYRPAAPTLPEPPPPPPPPAQYDSHPTYEYTSLYRIKANRTFEQALDAQLVALEHTVRASLNRNELNLVADKIIWQITTPKGAEKWRSWTSQWRENNSEWAYNLYIAPPTEFLRPFTSIPEIANAYRSYPGVREDLLKYAILWYNGGLWADIDTWARMAMRDCSSMKEVAEGWKDISLMVGVDLDEPFLSMRTIKAWGWTRGFGFAQYAMWAPKRFDPILRKAIVRAISHGAIQMLLASQNPRGTYDLEAKYTEELSGAGMFTDLILEILTESLVDDHSLRDLNAGLERRVTWKKFGGLNKTLWITPDLIKQSYEDVVRSLAVLPINVWGSGQDHSRSGPPDNDFACINHVQRKKQKRD